MNFTYLHYGKETNLRDPNGFEPMTCDTGAALYQLS